MEEMSQGVGETTSMAASIINDGLSFLSYYGWVILFAVIAICLAYVEFQPKWERWRRKLEDQRKAGELHKNPDKARALIEARERAIQCMQHSYNAEVEKHVEKLAQKEKEKRELFLAQTNNHPQVLGSSSSRPQTSTSSNKNGKPKLTSNDYRPLSDGGGGRFRSRRSGPSGG